MTLKRRHGLKAVPTESAEQQALVRWCALHETRHPELALLYHVPNAGSKHINYAARQRREGLKSGVPDLVLPVARGLHHGLYLELKRPSGGRVSPKQQGWIDRLRAEGYRAVVCHGWEAARDELLAYLALSQEAA